MNEFVKITNDIIDKHFKENNLYISLIEYSVYHDVLTLYVKFRDNNFKLLAFSYKSSSYNNNYIYHDFNNFIKYNVINKLLS